MRRSQRVAQATSAARPTLAGKPNPCRRALKRIHSPSQPLSTPLQLIYCQKLQSNTSLLLRCCWRQARRRSHDAQFPETEYDFKITMREFLSTVVDECDFEFPVRISHSMAGGESKVAVTARKLWRKTGGEFLKYSWRRV